MKYTLLYKWISITSLNLFAIGIPLFCAVVIFSPPTGFAIVSGIAFLVIGECISYAGLDCLIDWNARFPKRSK